MKTEIRAYLAGIVDGEGSIGLCHQLAKPNWKNKNCDHIRVQVDVLSNTNTVLILAVVNILRAEGFNPKVSHWQPEGAKSKQGHRIFLPCIDERKRFLRYIQPYLIGKKEQADIALEFLSRRGGNRKIKTSDYEWLLYDRMRFLNQRGRSSESVTTSTPGAVKPVKPAKIQSELYGDIQSVAEMPTPATDTIQ